MQAGTLRVLRFFGHILRNAARALLRAPAHALFILAILAVGVSAATVTFSVVDAVILKPLSFDDSEQLVFVTARNPRGPGWLTPEEFWTLHDRVTGFESVASITTWETPVTVDGATEDVRLMRCSAELFTVLRLPVLIGRVWTADDERRGDMQVAVIGYSLWQRRFGGDPAVLGRAVRLDERAYRIVGVLPAGVDFSDVGSPIEMWVPGVPDRPGMATGPGNAFATLGRVRPNVSLSQLTTEIQTAIAPLRSAQPPAEADRRLEAQRWRDVLVRDLRSWMLLVLGSVALVVLIACVNAANLTLTRSFERARELAVRASLGASRWQLALTLLAESLMLSVGASICALVFAAWGVGAVKAALPPGIVRAGTISLNGRVFVASILAAVVTGVLFGLVPAWQASRVSVVTLLKDAGNTVTPARGGWRSAFLIAEVACVAVLMVVSTLFIASFVRVTTLDLGFERSNLIAVKTLTDFEGTVADVKGRLARVPGVIGVAAVTYSSPPLVGSAFGGAWGDSELRAVGSTAGAATVEVELYRVTRDYFDVAGIEFRRGSTWSSATTGPRPIVIDEITARSLFGEKDSIGMQVHVTDLKDVFTIVGVVPYVLARGPERSKRPSAYYAMNPDTTPGWVSFLLRTSKPPAALVRPVETSLAPLLAPGASPDVRVVDEAFRSLTRIRRFHASLMSVFALLAILIGAAGIYAVMASVVAQQTREIGVRVALGATPSDIRRGVLARAARYLLLGLAVGLPAAWWISRGLGALLFQVRPSDVSIYIIVAVTLTTVGFVAAALPARRASRVDPVVSLRAS